MRPKRFFNGFAIGPRDHRFTPKVIAGSASFLLCVGAPHRHHLSKRDYKPEGQTETFCDKATTTNMTLHATQATKERLY